MAATRYTTLDKQTPRLYTEGSPVIIEAFALLKDNGNGAVIAQAKYSSISPKTITAMMICIEAFDVTGRELKGIEELQYLDLSVQRDAEFGQNMAIPLPDATTRRFKIRVSRVIFKGGSSWQAAEGAEWNTIPDATPLVAAIEDGELVEQYWKENGKNCSVEPMIYQDLWICAEDHLNRSSEEKCHICGKHYSVIDIDALQDGVNERKKQERLRLEEEQKARAEREEAERARMEEQKKKAKTMSIIAAIAIVICIAAVLAVTKFIIPNNSYQKAVKLKNAGKYEEAIAAFEAMTGYKDSSDQIILCQTAIKEELYNMAMDLLDTGDYEPAYALLEEIGNSEVIASSKYDRAMSLLASGDRDSAYMLLNGLDYKDSKEKAQSIKPYLLARASVGDVVIFGTYEQDNNTSNGKEDVEWIVLAKENGKILVISKYALDCQPYDTADNSTWHKSSLRAWMNESFLNNIFSVEEQKTIAMTNVSADKNPEYSTNPGNATTDKVFLLSISEAEKYFSSYSARECFPTKSALANGAYVNTIINTNRTCNWWLRSPGSISNYAAFVDNFGLVVYSGWGVTRSNYCCVRPALWIKLDS